VPHAPDFGPAGGPEMPPFPGGDGPPNAFIDCGPPGCPDCLCYVGVGAMWLQRGRLAPDPIAKHDPGFLSRITFGVPGADAGVAHPGNPDNSHPVEVNADSVPTAWQAGARAEVGWQWGPHALELSGYYMPHSSANRQFTDPGALDVRFGGFPVPAGFGGDDGNLFLQAGRVELETAVQIANAELNYTCECGCVHWIAGIRYFDLQERFSILTDDALSEANEVGSPFPSTIDIYTVRTANRICAGQVGFELQKCLVPRLALGLTSKNAFGVNFIRVNNTLERGDGLVGFDDVRTKTSFGAIIELDATLTWAMTDHIRLRAGYQALWAVHVAEPSHNVEYDLSIPLGSIDDRHTTFFQGPMLELMVAF
jgi:hypothetical protein